MTNESQQAPTYQVIARCLNCLAEPQLELKKGSRVDEQMCPNCGTDSLKARVAA